MAKKKSSSSRSIPPGRTSPIPARPDRDRRVRQNDRIARVLGVLLLLQSRGRWKLIEVFSLQLADHSQHQETIRTVQQSLLQRKCLTGVYDSPHETAPRKLCIHPYRLCLVKAAWYVVGRIDGEDSTKTFRIARFKSLRLLEEAAEVPTDFSLREYFGNAWAVFRGEKTYDVELRFIPAAARLVAETNWHHSQRAKTHRDGSVTLQFTVDGIDEILHWLLAWAGRVEVLKPAELKERFVEKLQQAIAQNS